MALYAAIIGTLDLALILALIWKTDTIDADITVASRLAYRALERSHEARDIANGKTPADHETDLELPNPDGGTPADRF